jgi:serine/threonine protein kinase
VTHTYTKVVFAIDLLENLGVAVKIIKNQKHFHEQAKTEIDLLSKFLTVPLPSSAQSEMPSSVYNHGRYLPCTQWVEFANIVRMLDTFTFRNHHCLVYLSRSRSLSLSLSLSL